LQINKYDFKTKTRHINTKEDKRKRTRHNMENTLSERNHDLRRKSTFFHKMHQPLQAAWGEGGQCSPKDKP
jgi:hypothetical protein